MYSELSFLFDQEHWYRCLVSEALAVMDMEDNVARANRGPWGLVKIVRSTEDSVKEAVKFMLKHLFIWVPVQVAVNVVQAHLRGQEPSRQFGTKCRLEKPEGTDTDGFSFYVHKIRMQSVALDKLQPHLPSVGHLFRIGAVQRNVADKLLRTVDMQINTELPIFKLQLGEFGGGQPPKEHLPRVWANESGEAVLIHKQTHGTIFPTV